LIPTRPPECEWHAVLHGLRRLEQRLWLRPVQERRHRGRHRRGRHRLFELPGLQWLRRPDFAQQDDFTGDGLSDIFWQNTSGQAVLWGMNGTTLSSAATMGPANGAVWTVKAIGDLNGDSKADLVWDNTSNGQASVWLMNGSTIQTAALVGAPNGSAWQVAG